MADLSGVDDDSLFPGALRSRQRHVGSQWHRNELPKVRHLQLVLWEELQAGEGALFQQEKQKAVDPQPHPSIAQEAKRHSQVSRRDTCKGTGEAAENILCSLSGLRGSESPVFKGKIGRGRKKLQAPPLISALQNYSSFSKREKTLLLSPPKSSMHLFHILRII